MIYETNEFGDDELSARLAARRASLGTPKQEISISLGDPKPEISIVDELRGQVLQVLAENIDREITSGMKKG